MSPGGVKECHPLINHKDKQEKSVNEDRDSEKMMEEVPSGGWQPIKALLETKRVNQQQGRSTGESLVEDILSVTGDEGSRAAATGDWSRDAQWRWVYEALSTREGCPTPGDGEAQPRGFVFEHREEALRRAEATRSPGKGESSIGQCQVGLPGSPPG